MWFEGVERALKHVIVFPAEVSFQKRLSVASQYRLSRRSLQQGSTTDGMGSSHVIREQLRRHGCNGAGSALCSLG